MTKSWAERSLQDDRLVAQQLLCLRYPSLRGLPLEEVIRLTSSSAAIPSDQVTRRKRSKRPHPKQSPSSHLDDVNVISSDPPPSSELDCKIPPSSSSSHSPANDEGFSEPPERQRSGCQVYEKLKIKIKIKAFRPNEGAMPKKSPRDFTVPDLNLPLVPSEEDQDS